MSAQDGDDGVRVIVQHDGIEIDQATGFDVAGEFVRGVLRLLPGFGRGVKGRFRVLALAGQFTHRAVGLREVVLGLGEGGLDGLARVAQAFGLLPCPVEGVGCRFTVAQVAFADSGIASLLDAVELADRAGLAGVRVADRGPCCGTGLGGVIDGSVGLLVAGPRCGDGRLFLGDVGGDPGMPGTHGGNGDPAQGFRLAGAFAQHPLDAVDVGVVGTFLRDEGGDPGRLDTLLRRGVVATFGLQQRFGLVIDDAVVLQFGLSPSARGPPVLTFGSGSLGGRGGLPFFGGRQGDVTDALFALDAGSGGQQGVQHREPTTVLLVERAHELRQQLGVLDHVGEEQLPAPVEAERVGVPAHPNQVGRQLLLERRVGDRPDDAVEE
jgi:hypothetical protein